MQEDVRTLLRDAIDAYEQGDLEKTATLLDKVLMERPSSDLAREMRDEIGTAALIKIMAEKHEVSKLATKLLDLAAKAEKRARSDETAIAAHVKDLKSPDFRQQFLAEQKIIHSIGHYIFLSDEVVEVLSNEQKDEFRVRVVRLLSEMGPHAVLPLVELMALPNAFGRQNVAAILGNIRDHRALPYLQRAVESDEDSDVKNEAAQAIIKITGAEPKKLPPSPELFLRHAEKYYYDDPAMVWTAYKDWVVWDFADGKLTHRPVPGYAYNEIMAEDLCYKGLAVNPSQEDLWILLLNTYYARITEVEGALEIAIDRVARGEMDQAEVDALQADHDSLGKARPLGTVLGEQGILKGLDRALADDRVHEAVAAIRALQDFPLSTALLPTGKAKEEKVKAGQVPPVAKADGAPLIRALFHGDKRVRYAAANAIVRLHPKTEVQYRTHAILNLIQAVGEKSPRLVLVIEGDPSLRNKTVAMLDRYHFLPMGVSSVDEGKKRGLFFPPEDLFIIGETLPDGQAHELIDIFKSDFRTAHVPILILTDPARVERAEEVYQGRADGIIPADIDEVVLKDRIDALFEGTEEGIKAKADRIAAEAAETLALIDPADTIFDTKDVAVALRETLEKRPDSVRIPAMAALGGLKDAGAIPMLTQVVTNQNNAQNARVAALDALGEILASQKAISPDVFVALKEAMAESTPEIYAAAGAALGKAPLDAQQKRDIYEAERIP
jgi:HEAT repeat protein